MHKTPLVSIIITTKDRAFLIKRCINSVINQTYSNLEIIIINDASKDNTKEILNEFKRLDSRIKVIHNKKILGSNPSRNVAINIAKGKFIAGLDDDDEFFLDRIEKLVTNYDSKYSFITSNNRLIYDDAFKDTNMPQIVTLKMMTFENVIMNQGLIKLSRIKKVGKYDENFTACQDYDLWMRLIIRYGNVKVLKDVTQKVYSEESRLRISSKSKNKFSAYFRFYNTYKYLMNQKAKKHHLYRLYNIRNKRLSYKTSLILSNEKDKEIILEYHLKNRMYKELINIVQNLSLIDEKIYILYGYGTIGKILFPIVQNKLVAIIDKTLSDNNILEINNIPVIKKEALINFKNNTIIVTPIIHYEKIKNELKQYQLNIIQIHEIIKAKNE